MLWKLKILLILLKFLATWMIFAKMREYYWQQQPLLTSITGLGEKLCRSRMSLREVMTMAIAFLGCWL